MIPFRTRALAAVVGCVCVLAGCSAATGRRPAELAAVRWRWRPPPPADLGMPAADKEGVVVTVSHVFVVSLRPDGSDRWTARDLGVREETPLMTPALVVVPTDNGLVAFERTTGQVRWGTRLGASSIEAPDPDDAASTPVLAGQTVLTCLSGGALVAVDADSGAVRWRVALPGRSDGPPATDGHTVVATWDPEHGDGAAVAAFDLATGERRWSAPLRAGAVGAPAIAGGARPFAVVVDHDLAAKAFDLATGRRLWATEVGAAGSPEVPPLPLGDGTVLVADRLAGLTLLDAGGHRRWSARAHAAAVRGGPVGPADGIYALPLYDGKVLLAGPGHGTAVVDAPGGLVSGVAIAPGGGLLVSSAQGREDQLVAYAGGADS